MAVPNKLPDVNFLRSILSYDPATGDLFWKHRPASHFSYELRARQWNTRYAGKRAFTAHDSGGYRRSSIGGQLMGAHRVVWAIFYGEEPPEQIDHINGVRDDNRIENLRPSNDQHNRKNQCKSKRNSSGVTGVTWSKAAGKWMAEIQSERKREYLGLFENLEAAAAARRSAEKRLGFATGHGKEL